MQEVVCRSPPYAMLELTPEGTAAPRLALRLETQPHWVLTVTYVRLKDQGSGEPSIRMGGATFQRPTGFLCSNPGPLLLSQG